MNQKKKSPVSYRVISLKFVHGLSSYNHKVYNLDTPNWRGSPIPGINYE
jgi:hypothetical protein